MKNFDYWLAPLILRSIEIDDVVCRTEQLWPSANALDSDQHGPGFEGPTKAIGDVRKGIRS